MFSNRRFEHELAHSKQAFLITDFDRYFQSRDIHLLHRLRQRRCQAVIDFVTHSRQAFLIIEQIHHSFDGYF